MNRILLIEDDAALAMGTEYALKAEGYEVIHAENLAESRRTLWENGSNTEVGNEAEIDKKVDIILLDVMLPDGNGFDFIKEIREHDVMTPVIFLTAVGDEVNIVQGLDSGADDYLTKPFATKELLARIRVLTRQSSAASDNLLKFGNLTLDRGSFELASPKGKYRLAGKEFQMMEMLMMNPGILISTERFMDKIWGLDSEADISTAWTYISYLRKKLAALDANVQIKAVRNSGYTLEETR